MAYDDELANRIRAQLAPYDAVTEQAMFGGLAFLVAGPGIATDAALGGWVARGVAFARTLPPKG